MGFCSFNDIGEFLSTCDTGGEVPPFRVNLPPDDVLVRESIFTLDGDVCVFAPKGLEAFIARKFCCPELLHAGNVCCFGTVNGRQLHYSAAPRPNFYNLHGAEASIIIGSNSADIPSGWKGHAALLSNVFTVKDGEILTASSGMKMLFPASGEQKKPAGTKKPNVRRRFWLEYLCDHISTLQQKYGVITGKPLPGQRRASCGKYDPRDFKRPKPKNVLAWMRKKTSVTIVSDQTTRRDIKAFEEFDPKKNKTQVYDKRDNLIAAVWKRIDDPTFVLNPRTLMAILDEMAKLKAPEIGPLAETAATAMTAWEDDADASGHGSTRTVAVAPDINFEF